MLLRFHFKGQTGNPEFQSALVRLGIWFFMLIFIGLGAASGYYPVEMEQLYTLFVVFFFIFSALLISVLIKPVSVLRQYIGLVVDIAGTSYSIVLSNNAVSPIFLLYIWIFISYGTRYGREHLLVATVASLLAYAAVVTHLNGWKEFAFEAYFFLLFMALMPVYQNSLIKKLQSAKQDAEQANQARGRFLATMTHEIRTPLSGIIGMSRIMQTDNLNSLQRQQLQGIRMSADKLELLIGDILDFSRIDVDRLELKESPFDARKSVFDICRSLSLQAADKGLELYCDSSSAVPPKLTGDPLRFSQIVNNLISNAIKFTERGEIDVTLDYGEFELTDDGYLDASEAIKTGLILKVTDTGIGISENNLQVIFDPFRQADDSRSRRYSGAGLGMAICKNLIRLMHGRISVQSTSGKGAEFTVMLPLAAAQAKPVEQSMLPALQLLVLETDPVYMRRIRQMAGDSGVQVRALQSFSQIKTLSNHDHYDALLVGESARQRVDVEEVIDLISSATGYRLPVIIMTYPGRSIRQRLQIAGLLEKPFSQEIFVDVIRQSLNLGQMHDEQPDRSAGELPDTKKRILVAEDDTISAQLISTLLSNSGQDFLIVGDGYTALREARTGLYDLAFVDLRMPDMDGIELTGMIRREKEPVSNMPVIALTANASAEARDDCLNAGMNDFLVKPIAADRLQEILKKYAV